MAIDGTFAARLVLRSPNMVEQAHNGFLTDTIRDVLAIAGVALGAFPFFSAKGLAALELNPPHNSEGNPRTVRLALLPLVFTISLPLAFTGWLLRASDNGSLVFGLLFMLGWPFSVCAFLAVYELLRRYSFSIRIFLVVVCALCAITAGFMSATPEFPLNGVQQQLSIFSAMTLTFFPLMIGGPIAVLWAFVRIVYKSF
jgi:hypothetical protein